MIYIFISIVILTLSFFIFRRAAGSLSPFKPNMISYIFYYNIFLQVFIGSVLPILYIDNHYVIGRVGMEVRFYAWASVMYMIIAFPLGMLLSKIIFCSNNKMLNVLNDYISKDINVYGFNGKALKYSVWCFTGISALACMYTFWKIGYYPFLKVLGASSSELASVRIAVSRDFSGNVYIRNFFALAMMPILSHVWIFYALANKKAPDIFMAFISSFFATSILYYNFAKSPLLWYILSFIFVYYYAIGKVRTFHAALLISVVFFGLILMYSINNVSIGSF
jgi:hypothetical protein